jgi:hypothetical protein
LIDRLRHLLSLDYEPSFLSVLMQQSIGEYSGKSKKTEHADMTDADEGKYFQGGLLLFLVFLKSKPVFLMTRLSWFLKKTYPAAIAANIGNRN